MKPLVESPCRDCADRVVGCHSNCERWAAYRVKADEAKRKYNKIKYDDADAVAFTVDNIMACRKKRHRKQWR